MTETTTNAERIGLADAVERYVRFWNPDAAVDLTAEALDDDVEYCAPTGTLTGPAALVDFRRQFAEHMGKYEFRLRSKPDLHHDRARVSWDIVTPDAHPFAEGTDVLVVDDRGRIRAVTVFLDRAPEGFDPHDHR